MLENEKSPTWCLPAFIKTFLARPMSLTASQVEAFQTTWEQRVPIADTAVDLFYGKLFELDLSLRSLFPEDMSGQKQKLMTMITTAIRGLSNLEATMKAAAAEG